MSYKIHLTNDFKSNFPDPDDSASSFDIKPYTTNGPVNPLNKSNDRMNKLYPGAIGAETTLVLYGKGMPNYGEGIQENMIHMLENFTSDVDPIYPLAGQLWNQTLSPEETQLRVHNNTKYTIEQAFDASSGGLLGGHVLSIPTDNLSVFEKEDLLRRWGLNYRIQLTHASTGKKERYTIVNGPIDRGDSLQIEISPPPQNQLLQNVYRTSDLGWYMGGWEYVLQNDQPLRNTFDAGGHRIKNLGEPQDPNDATSKGYVDDYVREQVDAATALHSLEYMDDIVLTNPQQGEVLRYDAASGTWYNDTLDDRYFKLTGGRLYGNIELNGNPSGVSQAGAPTGSPQSAPYYTIINMPYPIYGGQAANKYYVDDAIQGAINASSGAASLAGLSDVTVNPSTGSELLMWNGAEWVNVTVGSFMSSNSVITGTSGGNINAGVSFTTQSSPTITNWGIDGVSQELYPPAGANNNEIVPASYIRSYFDLFNEYMQSYVTGQVIAAASQDGVVDGVSYDPSTELLTLTRTQGLTDLTVSIPSGAADAQFVNMYTPDPNSGDVRARNMSALATDQFYEQHDDYHANWPQMDIQTVITDMSIALGRFAEPREAIKFTSNGNSTIYLNDIFSANPNQMNPTGPIQTFYVTGFNNLSVYVNGLKQYASTRAWVSIKTIDAVPPNIDVDLYPSTKTGLNASGTAYTFVVNVDGGGNQTVTINGTFHPIDSVAGLIHEINRTADTQGLGFGCYSKRGQLYFESNTSGASSNISIADGATSPLFASMVGVAGNTFIVDMGSIVTPVGTNYAPTTYHYREVGRYGTMSTQIVFEPGSIPTTGAVIEVAIEREYAHEFNLPDLVLAS